MDLSVIIPCRNVVRTIGEQLDALLKQSWSGDWEIVVVDNLSTDGTQEVLQRYVERDSRVRVVQCPEDLGVSHVRNLGIRHGAGWLLALCDGDDVVGEGWVGAMADALSEHEYVTGPLELDRLNSPPAIESRPGVDRKGAGEFCGVLAFAHSCNVGLRRSLVDQYGGFDLRFADSGDVELAIRLLRVGIEVHYSPDILVHYRLRATVGGAWRQARRNAKFYPMLASKARRSGLSVPRAAGAKYWPWLVWRSPRLRTQGGRARWCFVAGTAIGRIEGALKYKALYL